MRRFCRPAPKSLPLPPSEFHNVLSHIRRYYGFAFIDAKRSEALTLEVAGSACVSLIAMPLLSRAKKRVANELSSPAMHADARQTDFCFYLAVIFAQRDSGVVVGRSGRSSQYGPNYR